MRRAIAFFATTTWLIGLGEAGVLRGPTPTASDDATPLGCMWAGAIDVETGDACDATAWTRLGLSVGRAAHRAFSPTTTTTTTTAADEDAYVSCGSDDEGEGHRCCMAVALPKEREYCIDWNSGVPSHECTPKNCEQASKNDRFDDQVQCLDVFLDIDPATAGACRLVKRSECEALARKYPSTCSVPASLF